MAALKINKLEGGISRLLIDFETLK